ncbi:MAG: hypothetical protein IJO33_03225 [Bacilli bacterium]|nr:hypothetical protein [Bacilli bacterium]
MEKIFTLADFAICDQSGLLKTFQILGYIFIFLKIVIPILLIGLGSFELGKAVLSNDDKAIKIAISSLVKKAIAAVVIFFIPYVITAVMSLVDGADKTKKFDCLTNCLKEPSTCKINDKDGIFTE